ncbi:gamma-glutamylcyclotransferase [Pontivivens insulae]|uniref:gamma-glutamylcyclotransferase n=1 Tax=Pontivivens insulae TaxID=1639689 RepID=UPI0011B2659E|nr:gamma-glutamylcyclotransferase [Pontivivens insulae]
MRDLITPAEDSFWRTATVETLLASHPEPESIRPWLRSDQERETLRKEALRNHFGDLWVFAYGSLMWDPALLFAEVRRGFAPSHARRFILVDSKGGRGTAERPGLMAALDDGEGCEGLVFRIAEDQVESETQVLFQREMVGPGYHALFVPVRIGNEQVSALTFLADHNSDLMDSSIARADQVRMAATGVGFLGSSRDYLANIVSQFAHLRIHDPDCETLLKEVDAAIAEGRFEI